MPREEWERGHVVDGNREEPLNLPGVQVHREDAISARQLEHVCDQAARDRLARLRLPILPRVGKQRHDCRDALR